MTSNTVGPNLVLIYEDWNERPDGVYYRWSLDGKIWNERLTAYKQKPVVQMKYVSQQDYYEKYAKGDRGII